MWKRLPCNFFLRKYKISHLVQSGSGSDSTRHVKSYKNKIKYNRNDSWWGRLVSS
jgi:hypothetical protein